MKTFRLTVSSPDGNKFDGEVVKLDVRGTCGELAVMAGHIPFVTSVIAAPCVLHFEDGDERRAYSEGGMLCVGTDRTVFLSGTFAFEDK